jgi:hypothetical protein
MYRGFDLINQQNAILSPRDGKCYQEDSPHAIAIRLYGKQTRDPIPQIQNRLASSPRRLGPLGEYLDSDNTRIHSGKYLHHWQRSISEPRFRVQVGGQSAKPVIERRDVLRR